MANEFIARKGIISLDSIQVTGSITATGGITISGSISSASFATSAATASSADNFFVRQNVTASNMLATGRITAQTLVVQTVTSSIVYSSGSNIFGNQLTDIQQLTGSVRVTGSFTVVTTNPELTVGTTGVTLGNVLTDVHQVTGSLRITGSSNHFIQGGNVGIGTSSPGSPLTVQNRTDDFSATVRLFSTENPASVARHPSIIIGWGTADVDRYIRLGTGPDTGFGTPFNNVNYLTSTGKDFIIGTGANAATLAERMRITSAGDVGIGTTSPQNYAGYTSLTIGDNDVNKRGLLKFKSCFNSGAGAEIFQSTAGVLSFSTTGAGVEMAINCSGAVGIGCSTPSYRLDILDTCASGVRGLRVSTASSSVGPSIILNYCPGGLTNWLIGTSQAVSRTLEFIASNALGGDPGASGTTRMLITCGGEVGIKTTSTSTEANLFLGAQGTVEGGQLVLQKGTSCSCATHLDNYQNQFRIMSGTDTGSTIANVIVNHVTGNVLIGSSSDDARLTVQPAGSGYGQVINHTNATNQFFISFRYNTTTIGTITGNNTNTAYNTSSDYRLKKDFKNFNGLDIINLIKAYDFAWKVDNSRMYGMIAHELQEVLPYTVTGEKDGDEMQGVDYSKLTPVLVKAIQEQQCQICTQSIIIDQLKTCLGII